MAHFARLDNNNIVQQVVVVHNNELLDENGQESEVKGITFCESLFGGTWVQTSYTGSFRKNFAGIGYVYDRENEVFYPPQPHPGWVINKSTWTWEAPIPYPNDGNDYFWDENINNWVIATTE